MTGGLLALVLEHVTHFPGLNCGVLRGGGSKQLVEPRGALGNNIVDDRNPVSRYIHIFVLCYQKPYIFVTSIEGHAGVLPSTVGSTGESQATYTA